MLRYSTYFPKPTGVPIFTVCTLDCANPSIKVGSKLQYMFNKNRRPNHNIPRPKAALRSLYYKKRLEIFLLLFNDFIT
jgi:hypothetical protein